MRFAITALALLCTLLGGALARDLCVARAGAEEGALRRPDVERIVKALEDQARATRELAREVREAGRGRK